MDRDSTESRRATLRRLTACLFAAAAGLISVARGREQEGLVCARPSALSEAEKPPDPGKTCSACRFFTPGAGATACGKCALFNGPANPRGKCDDWTARPV